MQGNLANKNGQLYSFDYGNRLREVPGKETYRYDGLGRRVQTTKTDGSQTLWQYSQSGQMLFSWNGPSSEKTHENVYLGGSLVAAIDHDWPSNAVIATKYQHADALGSPVAVTNEAGTVIDRTNYEPYGAAINKPNYNGIGYTGHVMDGATGLTYMQQRYFDKDSGRFLSIDPVAANSSTGANFNRYWYANNNPYKFTDPDGRYSCEASLCNAVRAGITAMKESRDTYSRSSPEYKLINAVVRSIGTKDDGNGPNYRSGTLDGETGTQTDQKGTVTIDISKVSNSTDMARNIGHEGQHDIDTSVNGVASTEGSVRATEENAYTTEAIIANGLGVKLNPVDVGKAIDKSVENAMKSNEKEKVAK